VAAIARVLGAVQAGVRLVNRASARFYLAYLISGRLPVSQAVESGSSSLALWGTEKVDQCFYHGGP
jgi:hypothetical protein